MLMEPDEKLMDHQGHYSSSGDPEEEEGGVNMKFHGNRPTAVETFHSNTQNVSRMVALKEKSTRRRHLGTVNPSLQFILQMLSHHNSGPGNRQTERPTLLAFES